MSALSALSPLDGRYGGRMAELAATFSELALMKHRLHVEVEWFIALSQWPAIPELPPVSPAQAAFLRGLVAAFDEEAAARVKAIEGRIHHDVKAVEYYLKEQLAGTSLAAHREFVHFACTSEDINNLAYALMLRRGVGEIWLREAEGVIAAIEGLARRYRRTPMLAHTHGQPASPTTAGKEMAVFAHRLRRQQQQIARQPYLGKINGAVGNFNAHVIAYPHADWPAFARAFVEETLGLTCNPLTTQIESHDFLAELFHALMRFNTILLDFARDMWLYIAKGYFRQKAAAGEVGSSTMPHKVNPIDFENAEGNIGLSNAMLAFMAGKLPVSRWQRDLSDSTVLRNMGQGVGYSLLAMQSLRRGIGKVAVDEARLQEDLAANWAVLSEAVQTVMRKAGLENPYEQLKALTRGKSLTAQELAAFIRQLPLPEEDRARLLALTPADYTGLAAQLVPLPDED